jgi:hypothetical protein
MMRRRKLRQGIAAVLVVAGAALMLLSPSVGPGLLAFGCGVVLELVGQVLERRNPP